MVCVMAVGREPGDPAADHRAAWVMSGRTTGHGEGARRGGAGAKPRTAVARRHGRCGGGGGQDTGGTGEGAVLEKVY